MIDRTDGLLQGEQTNTIGIIPGTNGRSHKTIGAARIQPSKANLHPPTALAIVDQIGPEIYKAIKHIIGIGPLLGIAARSTATNIQSGVTHSKGHRRHAQGTARIDVLKGSRGLSGIRIMNRPARDVLSGDITVFP